MSGGPYTVTFCSILCGQRKYSSTALKAPLGISDDLLYSEPGLEVFVPSVINCRSLLGQFAGFRPAVLYGQPKGPHIDLLDSLYHANPSCAFHAIILICGDYLWFIKISFAIPKYSWCSSSLRCSYLVNRGIVIPQKCTIYGGGG